MRFTLTILFLIVAVCVEAQRYRASSGSVKFYSEAPLEDIEAVSNDVGSVYDVQSGEIVFSIPMRSFEFDKSLMQEHFNDQYVESDKYPKSTFKGKVTGFNPDSNSNQSVKCEGDLTIHGVTQYIKVEGNMAASNGKIVIKCVFPVSVKDYEIKIPKLLWENIAEVVEVTVACEYREL